MKERIKELLSLEPTGYHTDYFDVTRDELCHWLLEIELLENKAKHADAIIKRAQENAK